MQINIIYWYNGCPAKFALILENCVPSIFIGSSHNGKPTAELKRHQVTSFEEFCTQYLSTCIQGEKHAYYFTIGDDYKLTPGDISASPLSYKASDHYHRNNISQTSAWLLPFDGDNSFSSPGSCVDPQSVHRALTKLGYNHAIYTTHSHRKDEKIRWRLVLPCKMGDPAQLGPTVNYLYRTLQSEGIEDLAMSTESKTWSVPWFLPTRDNPYDEEFEYYAYFIGKDFVPVDPPTDDGPALSGIHTSSEASRSTTDLLEIVAAGQADTGLHRATRDLAYGLVKDGLAPGAVKSVLYFLCKDYDTTDPRQRENAGKIEALVDSATAKVLEEVPTSTDWEDSHLADENRSFTDYPNQGGKMEDIVQCCMNWMPYPNRQIAVIAAHSLISTLGGRVYSLENGSGIVLTALVTGRSTIGKSFIKKFCIFALNNFQLAAISQDFIGSHFYTSSKNLVAELQESGSLLSVRTESGQSDKSNAGDMTRVLMYELELATESGMRGYVSSGGQNEKIPALYSPAVTTIRESVAQIQHEADLINATAVSGVAGRRSHVLIDPVKGSYNESQISELPDNIKNTIKDIYKIAANEQRKNITSPLPAKLWTIIKFKNPQYMAEKRTHWIKKENKAALNGNHFESTFYGRLGERLPAWAARLAICDNPIEPVITKQHVDIAEASLLAELYASVSQQESGELDSDINQVAAYVVNLFRGDMSSNKSLLNKTNKIMLKDGACELHRIMNRARAKAAYKRASMKHPNIDNILLSTVKTRGLVELKREEAISRYGYGGRVLKRV